VIVGLRCAVCAATLDIATPLAWKCPNATPADPHHVLHFVEAGPAAEPLASDHPFVRYGPRLAWWQFARAHGMTAGACEALTHQVLGPLEGGFTVTPFHRSDTLAAAVGVDLWAKDETGNVAGSHKARHLASILLHLRAAETLGLLPGRRAPLAIASCGNAALAAATLAAVTDWPLHVFVPTWMSDAVGAELDALGAHVHPCPRLPDDPPGDPAVLRFREAVAAGSIPFSVQGPDNAYCLDGGRTLGWEVADQSAAVGIELAAVYVQVGGGALAACTGRALGRSVALRAVQADGAAPFDAALRRAAAFDRPERHWPDVMRAWPEPHSLADGILDDETYDWIAARDAVLASGGRSIVAPEADIVGAHSMAVHAGFRVSVTGSAGLAGVLADGEHGPGPIAVIMSGVGR
jgi:threonine synthase